MKETENYGYPICPYCYSKIKIQVTPSPDSKELVIQCENCQNLVRIITVVKYVAREVTE